MTILKTYVEALTKRAQDYKEAESYYTGAVSERFASAKLRQALRTTQHRGQQNYCRIVVDAVLNRLEIANVSADTARATDFITEVWDYNELALEANVIHRGALSLGDAYAIAWPDADGKWRVGYHSAKNVAIGYDPEDPRKKLWAVQVWQHDENTVKLNVYTPEAITKYSAQGTTYTEGTNWSQIDSVDNPFGEVPVFHFRTHRPNGLPEHLQAYGAQDDINKLLATHMFTVDYQGAPQRYALAMNGDNDVVDFGDDKEEADSVSRLKSSPGEVWYMKGIDRVGEFKPADPAVFTGPVSTLKQAISALTDTPFHYLERPQNISGGEALRASEAPLLKKVADRQVSFGATWRELFNFILKHESIKARLEVKWNLVESLDALGKWDVIAKKINAGLSHAQALREGGYEESEIQRILEERAAESDMYNRSDVNGETQLVAKRGARVSTADNAALNENRNGITEDAKVNGGRGEKAAA